MQAARLPRDVKSRCTIVTGSHLTSAYVVVSFTQGMLVVFEELPIGEASSRIFMVFSRRAFDLIFRVGPTITEDL